MHKHKALETFTYSGAVYKKNQKKNLTFSFFVLI